MSPSNRKDMICRRPSLLMRYSIAQPDFMICRAVTFVPGRLSVTFLLMLFCLIGGRGIKSSGCSISVPHNPSSSMWHSQHAPPTGPLGRFGAAGFTLLVILFSFLLRLSILKVRIQCTYCNRQLCVYPSVNGPYYLFILVSNLMYQNRYF